jgi:squalene monooxygenase
MVGRSDRDPPLPQNTRADSFTAASNRAIPVPPVPATINHLRAQAPGAAFPEGIQAVVAGGGLAGTCAAAALAARGYRVLLVEPGVAHVRRLAGELLHPPALADLRALGLDGAVADAGGQPVDGFAVFFDGDGPTEERCVLPYSVAEGLGATVEHGPLVTALVARVAALPGVTVMTSARVDGVTHVPGGVIVSIAAGETRHEVRAELLVAADGRASNVRRLAGISATRQRLSTMAGFVVPTDTLPCPGRGHIFVSGAAPVLAYAIAPGRVRVMVDVSEHDAREVISVVREPERLRALPEPFRSAVAAVIATQRPVIAANLTIIPSSVVCGRVVLVGDAAGCCHPISASGLASAAHDARVLADAIAATPYELDRALRRYARRRQQPHGVRIALASALYRAFAETSPEMVLLRRGLIDYWSSSPRGRSVSMALLATSEQRYTVLAGEYARVAGHALPALLDRNRPRLPRRKALRGLLASVAPYVGGAVAALLPQRSHAPTAVPIPAR